MKLYKIKQILKFKKDLKIDENVAGIAVENDDQALVILLLLMLISLILNYFRNKL